MTLDTIMVLIAVTAMFATLAVVLGWTGKEVDWRASRKQAAAALPPHQAGRRQQGVIR